MDQVVSSGKGKYLVYFYWLLTPQYASCLIPFPIPLPPFPEELLPSVTYILAAVMDQAKTPEASIEKLNDGSATTSLYCLPPSPDLDVEMYGIASSPPAADKGSPSSPHEPQESISHSDGSLSEQLMSLNVVSSGFRKDFRADPPSPEVYKPLRTRKDDTPYDSCEAFDQTQFARLVHANKDLIEEQQAVSAKRSQVRELRQALKSKREEELDLRTALMKKLNALFAQPQGLSNIQALTRDYEALQLITEAYMDLENSYHEAEDQLEQQEYRLGKSMQRFSSLSKKGLPRVSQDPGRNALENDSFTDEGDDTASMTSTAHETPQGVAEYLSRVGDVRLLQEQLLDLDSQWLAIMDKQKQRGSLHVPLDDESLQFLRTYDEERRKMWYDLNHAQLDVNQFRSICEENGLLTAEHMGDMEFLYPLGSESPTRQMSDDPLKLSVDEGSAFFFEPQTADQLSPTRFVNKWMLHQLRSSSIEIRRLKSRPELQLLWDRGFSDTVISHWVLREWFSDDAGLSSRPPSTIPPDEDHVATTGGALPVENRDKPLLSKSHSVPFLRRASAVPELRYSRSLSFFCH